ncbi:hypothetical protein [Malaciobacter marinus]|uniref:hypothetical protein n=1 Tax=Malaciobacter marinus TaxID=505249 RepID=UPI001055AE84|nr:hypothetical protein [Malaciobacter marinus]
MDILIIMIILIFTALQFYVTKYVKIAVPFIVVLLMILQISSKYNENKYKKLTLSKFNKIENSVKTNIDWNKSSFILSFIDSNIDKQFIQRVPISLKIYPLDNAIINKKVNINKFIQRANFNTVFDYKELKYEDSMLLFNLFADKNGNIYYDEEKQYEIDQVFLNSVNIKKNNMSFDLNFVGTEPFPRYDTLEDLNNTILITRIPTLFTLKPFNVAKTFDVKLNTGVGEKILSFNIKPFPEGKFKLLEYAAIYIPKNYFN